MKRPFVTFTCLAILTGLSLMLFSCGNAQDTSHKSEGFDYTPIIPIQNLDEISDEQALALNALDTIQVQGNHLYSTFAALRHDCFPPDTSFVISQQAFANALAQLLSSYYPEISVEQQDSLAKLAAMAQQEYFILHCTSKTISSGQPPPHRRYGTWIMPSVLGRRDIVIWW